MCVCVYVCACVYVCVCVCVEDHVFPVLTSESIGQSAQTDTRKEVNSESSVSRVVPRKKTPEHVLHIRVAETVPKHR